MPLWVDFADGSVPFWSTVFARPGVVGAASNFLVPPQLRAQGAKTVYFDLYMNRRTGTPSAPADPAKIEGFADKLFETAAQSSGCDKPLIALNELFGASTPTPWTATTAQYRANVLALLQRLAGRGARPFLLLSSNPYTHDVVADDWWRQVAQVADLVPEVYFSGPSVSAQGAAKGSKRLRATLRNRVRDLTAIGVPATRVGVMLTFSSTPRAGGRENLRPLSKWLDVVKWEVLAAKQVAAETGIASVWSWGWGTWNPAGNDPDKGTAACVYLWTRDHTLCDAPAVAGTQLDTSLQIGGSLQAGTLCILDGAQLTSTAVTALGRVTGDRDVALSALLQRAVITRAAPVSVDAILAAERDVIVDRFAGKRPRYLAALAASRANTSIARDVLADELRRRQIQAGLHIAAPTQAQIEDYAGSYDAEPARFVRTAKRVRWLGDRTTGVALRSTAPGRLFALPPGGKATIDGVEVTVLGESAPLGAFPIDAARSSIRASLAAQSREHAFTAWSARRQNQALSRLDCVKDELPQPATVDLTEYLPFLAVA